MPPNTTFVYGSQTSGPTFTIANPPEGGLATIVASIPTLGPGVSATFSLVLLVSPSTADGANFTSTGSLTSSTPDPNPANNYQSNSFVAGTLAGVTVTNTVSSGPPIPGGTVAYTVTVANGGPSDAQSVAALGPLSCERHLRLRRPELGTEFHLTAPSAGGTGAITGTIATLAAGATASFTVVVTVPPRRGDRNRDREHGVGVPSHEQFESRERQPHRHYQRGCRRSLRSHRRSSI